MAEDTDFETLKNVTLNLKKVLECPICWETVKRPFKLCARGHLMCSGCLKSLTACPTCQGAFLLENPVCIKNLLENLPHKCQHSANGCKKIVEVENHHEKFCGFRHIKCRATVCTQDVFANELLEHYKTTHPGVPVIKEEIETGLEWSKFDPVIKRVSNNLVHIFEKLFWFTLHNCNEDKKLKLTLEAIPIGKFEGDYYLTVSFINGKFDFRYTLKAFPEETEFANVGSDKMNHICMVVPQIMLSHFIEKNGALKMSLFFFKG